MLLGSSISRFCDTITIVLPIWNILSIVKDIAASVDNSALYSLKTIQHNHIFTYFMVE